jgi:hypothetical protein
VHKIEMEIEGLLRWAYMDELSKRQCSAAEGIWDRIQENQHHGGIDRGHGAAQRYAHFGLPDPDAELIERAVSTLADKVIDWNESFDVIASDLSGLVSINDLSPRNAGERSPRVGWGEAGTKALNAWYGQKGTQPLPVEDRPRDALLVGGIKTNVLVTVHAIKGTRPEWRDEMPVPSMMPAAKGPNAAIVGECKGRNIYSTGSYCPLRWSPSPLSIVTSRAEYAAWHQGLVILSQTLQLAKFIALPPKAPATPWVDDNEVDPRVIPVMPTGRNSVKAWGTLPLSPSRGRTAPPKRFAKAGSVRYPLEACE